MKRHIYYPPEDIKNVASIYESEIYDKKVYVYRKVPEEEIKEYYTGRENIELDNQGRIFLFVKNNSREVERVINSYWEVIRKMFKDKCNI